MPEFYKDDAGKIMAREAAGGSGGGVTSYVTRPATSYEALMFHEREVARTEAAAAAAKEAHAEHVKAAEGAAEPDANTQRPDDQANQQQSAQSPALGQPDANHPPAVAGPDAPPAPPSMGQQQRSSD